MADGDHSLKLLTFNERCRWEAWRDPARIKPGLVRKIFHEQAWAPDVEVEIIPLLDRLAAGRIVAQRDGRDLATRFWGHVLAEARRLQQEGYLLGLSSFKLVMMIEERTRGALIPTEIEAAPPSQTPLAPEPTEALAKSAEKPASRSPKPAESPQPTESSAEKPRPTGKPEREPRTLRARIVQAAKEKYDGEKPPYRDSRIISELREELGIKNISSTMWKRVKDDLGWTRKRSKG